MRLTVVEAADREAPAVERVARAFGRCKPDAGLKVELLLDADGKVTTATATGGSDPAARRCVETVARDLRFAPGKVAKLELRFDPP